MIITVTSAGEWRAGIRADLDVLAGTAIDYSGIDGPYTTIAAELAFEVQQGFALAVSGLFLATAPRPVVVARLLDAGLTPLDATSSRYTAYVVGSGFIPGSTIWQGGGSNGRAQWRTVTDETILSVTDGDPLVIEAVETGPVQLTGVVSINPVTPVLGPTGLAFDASDGDPYQLGRDAETVARMRVRASRPQQGGGSYGGIRSRLLEIPWVVAADVRGGAGLIDVTVAPGPVGADQELEIGQALYDVHAGGITIRGALAVPAVDVQGRDITVGITVGTTQAVAVGITVDPLPGAAEADITSAVQAAVAEAFARLATGQTIYRLDVFRALASVEGVVNAALLLDGTTTQSITPATAADVLVPSPITVSYL